MTTIYPDFLDLCRLLNEEAVEYLVVGGYAVAFHGAPRFTGDLDLLVNPSNESIRGVLQALTRFGFPAASLAPEELVRERNILQLGLPPVQVHVMFHASGITWQEAWNTREAGLYGDCRVHYLGREALIRNKRAAGRPKDLADVAALE